MLIGIDAYPAPFRSLAGCVNDIDAIEAVLLEPPGVGVPVDQLQVQRFAAPQPSHVTTSRLTNTLPPSRATIVQALSELAATVQPHDRVLIYYAGHGDQRMWQPAGVTHEALCLTDGAGVEYLWDVELNPLLFAIGQRTTDVTLVLDCCHANGATRTVGEPEGQVTSRFLGGGSAPLNIHIAAPVMRLGLDPPFMAVVACLAHERASELVEADGRSHGLFTASLVGALRAVNPAAWPGLRWVDMWPRLLAGVLTTADSHRLPSQHPAWWGRLERPIFGGPFQPRDPGFALTPRPDGRLTVAAGEVMGVGMGAVVAVYGDEWPIFPPLGSPEDREARQGRELRVISAEASQCVAEPLAPGFTLPTGGRGRLVQVGALARLTVRLDPHVEDIAAFLAQSAFLRIITTNAADVVVSGTRATGWTISDAVEPAIAQVAPGETGGLLKGLEWYSRVHRVLTMPDRCIAPELQGSLRLRLLDCATLPVHAGDAPDLPEVARDAAGLYALRNGGRFCIELQNVASQPLHVTVFDVSAGGGAWFIGTLSVAPDQRVRLWRPDSPAETPFEAHSDFETATPPRASTDRLITLATTRLDVDLAPLAVHNTVQSEVDFWSSTMDLVEAEAVALPPGAEWWTGLLTPLRVGIDLG